VRFEAEPKSKAGGVFGLRLLTAAPAQNPPNHKYQCSKPQTIKQAMNKITLLALSSLLLAPLAALQAADTDDILLFSFFRDNGQAGIYLAASDDGLHFTPLNNDQP